MLYFFIVMLAVDFFVRVCVVLLIVPIFILVLSDAMQNFILSVTFFVILNYKLVYYNFIYENCHITVNLPQKLLLKISI